MQYQSNLQAAVNAVKKAGDRAVVPTPLPAPIPGAAPSLAMMYSPRQTWGNVYDAQTALSRGTIFPELDKPFLRGACSSNV